jgi:hypothetical protein
VYVDTIIDTYTRFLRRKQFLFPKDRNMVLEGLIKAKFNFPDEDSTVLEFGVCDGASYIAMAEHIILHNPTITLYGFDSWQGLPDETEGVWKPKRHNPGMFSASKNDVLNQLWERGADNDPRFKLIDGFFENSLTKELQSKIKNLIFVNIDVDLHKSTVELLEFIYPLLRKGVILYFDDWKDPQDSHDGKWGEHLAWEEYIQKYPNIKYETIKINNFNQRLIEITDI